MEISDDIPGERLVLRAEVVGPRSEVSRLAALRGRLAARSGATIAWLRSLPRMTFGEGLKALLIVSLIALIAPLVVMVLVLIALLIAVGAWMVAFWLVRSWVRAALPAYRAKRIGLPDRLSLLRFTPEVIEAYRGSRRSWSLVTKDVTSAQLAAGPGGEWLALTLRLEAAGTRVIERFGVEALDRDDEVLDLAFRIARILRWRHYRTTRDGLGLEATLLSQRQGHGAHPFRAVIAESEAREVPAISEAAQYHLRSAPPRVRRVPPDLEPYVPSNGVLDIDAWKPGQSVRTSARPQRSLSRPLLALLYGLVITAAIAAVAYGLGLVFDPYIWQSNGQLAADMARWTIASGILGALLAAFDGAKRRGSLTSSFNWSDKTLTVVQDERKQSIAFDALGALVLREVPAPDGKCHHVVEARSPGEHDVLIYQSAPRKRSKNGRPPELALTIELATALKIPWRWE